MKYKLSTVFVLFVSSYLAVTSVFWFNADLNAKDAYSFMDRWHDKEQVGTLKQWNSAHKSMQKALSYNPYSVDYLIEMGQLYEWGATAMTFRSDEEFFLQNAKTYYLKAIEARPTWPLAWANYAHTLILLQENVKQIDIAIKSIDKYGPWNEEAQKKMFIASFKVWENLPKLTQVLVFRALRKWLKSDRRNMTRFIIATSVKLGKGYLVRLVLDDFDNDRRVDHLEFLEKRIGRKKDFCRGTDCIFQPIVRFDKRFEV